MRFGADAKSEYAKNTVPETILSILEKCVWERE
jgi:hypothetical protein